MKGKSFTTPEGNIVTVAEFDESNKIAMLTDGLQNKWVDEKDYNLWKPLDTIFIPDTPMEMEEADIKPKKKK